MTHRLSAYLVSLMLICLLSGDGVYPVLAQADTGEVSTIRINYPRLTTVPDQQQLEVYFTPLNPLGQAVDTIDIQDATITVGGTRYTGTVDIASDPLSVVLVLDTSGSMADGVDAVRRAAEQAVNLAPEGASFAVYTFNDVVTPLIGFSSDKISVIRAIRQLDETNFRGGTCLYNALDDAIRTARTSGGIGRRAVVAFTDGRDEITINSGEPCSDRADESQVIDEATSALARVPLYTIGLQGSVPLAETSLRNMARSTGGLYLTGSKTGTNDIVATFSDMIRALNSQRVVRATICETRGDYSVAVAMNAGNTTVSDEIVRPISVTTDCTPPEPTAEPTPGTIMIQPPYIETGQLIIEVRLAGDGITGAEMFIENAETGLLINNPQYQRIPLTLDNPIARLPNGVVPPDGINIRVQALNAGGQVIAEDIREDVQPFREPTATPAPTATPIQIGLVIESIQQDENRLILNLNVSRDPLVRGYELRIFDAETNNLISRVSRPEAPPDPLIIERADLENPLTAGTYRFVLELQLQGFGPGMALPSAESELTIDEEAQSIFSVFSGNNVIALVLLTIVVLAVLGLVYYVLQTRRQREKKTAPSETLTRGEINVQPPSSPARVSPPPTLTDPVYDDETIASRYDAFLEVQKSPKLNKGERKKISPVRELTIGRGMDCDILIDDPRVSQRHARIAWGKKEKQYVLIDLGSQNGTWLNGQRIEKRELYPLRRQLKQVINIADQHRFQFSYEDSIGAHNPTEQVVDDAVDQKNRLPSRVEARIYEVDVDGQPVGEISMVPHTPFRIGRSPGMEMSIDRSEISQEHAVIEWSEHEEIFMLISRGRNGTSLNTQTLKSGVPYTLSQESINLIELGRGLARLHFRYSLDGIDPRQIQHDDDRLFMNEALPEAVTAELRIIQENGRKVFQDIVVRQRVIIGRERDVDLQVKSTDSAISRRHAVILWMAGEKHFILQDLGSANGTQLDGSRLQASSPIQLDPDHLYTITLSPHSDKKTIIEFLYTLQA